MTETSSLPPVRPEPADVRLKSRPPAASATAIIFVVAVAALYFGRDVFVPLAVAILLSFVLAPLVLRLRRLHIARVPSVLIAVVIAFVVIAGIGAIMGTELAGLAKNLPQYQQTIETKIQTVRGAVTGSGIVARVSSLLGNFRTEIAAPPGNTGGKAANAPAAAGAQHQPVPVEIREAPLAPFHFIERIIGGLLQPLGTIGIVIVFLLFILLQREDLRDRFIRLAGANDLHRTTQALDDGVRRLSRYFLMQGAINTTFGVLIGIGLFFIGVPTPVLWGILGTLLRFIPYIGAPIAAVFPATVAFAVAPGWSMLVETLGLFLVVEPIMAQVVDPLLYGRSTGLSAVAVVVSAAFWTWLWGPIGLLLSTPLTMCLVVLGRHAEHLQFLDILLGDQPALTSAESFYQRVLAGDPDEAAHQAEDFLRDRPLSAYYDEIAIKGLALAQLDVNRGVLDHDRRVQIKETIDDVIDNLSDHQDAAPGRTADGGTVADSAARILSPDELAPAWREAPAMCVAGRGSLDEAAAAMLAQLLGKHGIGARVVPSQAVSAANIVRFDAVDAPIVCLSYLEPGGLTSARYLARRLRRKLPRAKILLGLWTLSEGDSERLNALKETGVDLVVTSLRQAVEGVLAEATDAVDVAGEAANRPPAIEPTAAAG